MIVGKMILLVAAAGRLGWISICFQGRITCQKGCKPNTGRRRRTRTRTITTTTTTKSFNQEQQLMLHWNGLFMWSKPFPGLMPLYATLLEAAARRSTPQFRMATVGWSLKPTTIKSINISQMRTMVLEYLPTNLPQKWLKCRLIFQHHGSHLGMVSLCE